MPKVITYAPHAARRAAQTRSPAHTSMVNDITEVLVQLGGQAHSTLVIEQVARLRGHALPLQTGFREAIVRAFETQIDFDTADGETAIFCLPFGVGSNRWALERDTYHLIRAHRVRERMAATPHLQHVAPAQLEARRVG
jgi:hypothetical protein